MRLIDFSNGLEALLNAIAAEEKADYVYMYPPRQAYRTLDSEFAMAERTLAINEQSSLDLYLHFPFCRQICSFCNLFATANNSAEKLNQYFLALSQELESSSALLGGKRVNSIYLGGGTPSMFDTKHLVKTLHSVGSLTQSSLKHVPEVSMEVAPDTVTKEKFRALVEAGLTRVNVGAQSLNPQEVGAIGRKHSTDVIVNSIETLLEAGIQNVSVDLIISLPGQSFDNWKSSVDGVISLNPDTICLYPFTQRPMTGFGRIALEQDDLRYAKWDYAKSRLHVAGFDCETHVRWKKRNSAGGYIQKQNHWGLKNILGFGAGARSYTSHIDTRNGYSLRNRGGVVQNYVEAVSSGVSPVTEGFVMSLLERKRKALVLNLIDLSRSWYATLFESDPLADFPKELLFLQSHDLVSITEAHIRTTAAGLKYRDLVVQAFFSDEVRRLIRTHDYNEKVPIKD